MSLRINHNIASLNGYRNLLDNNRAVSSSLQKLSSGLRINKAADDAAGLVISEQMRAQVTGLEQAIDNSETAVAMVQTAEGALDEVNSLLLKARELALHAANEGANDTNQLVADQAELDNVISSINRIADYTQFGTKKILDGTLNGVARDSSGNQIMDTEFTRIQVGNLANNSAVTNNDFTLSIGAATKGSTTATAGQISGAVSGMFNDTSTDAFNELASSTVLVTGSTISVAISGVTGNTTTITVESTGAGGETLAAMMDKINSGIDANTGLLLQASLESGIGFKIERENVTDAQLNYNVTFAYGGSSTAGQDATFSSTLSLTNNQANAFFGEANSDGVSGTSIFTGASTAYYTLSETTATGVRQLDVNSNGYAIADNTTLNDAISGIIDQITGAGIDGLSAATFTVTNDTANDQLIISINTNAETNLAGDTIGQFKLDLRLDNTNVLDGKVDVASTTLQNITTGTAADLVTHGVTGQDATFSTEMNGLDLATANAIFGLSGGGVADVSGTTVVSGEMHLTFQFSDADNTVLTGYTATITGSDGDSLQTIADAMLTELQANVTGLQDATVSISNNAGVLTFSIDTNNQTYDGTSTGVAIGGAMSLNVTLDNANVIDGNVDIQSVNFGALDDTVSTGVADPVEGSWESTTSVNDDIIFTLNYNGKDYSYTSNTDTFASVASGLEALVQADDANIVVSFVSGSVTLTGVDTGHLYTGALGSGGSATSANGVNAGFAVANTAGVDVGTISMNLDTDGISGYDISLNGTGITAVAGSVADTAYNLTTNAANGTNSSGVIENQGADYLSGSDTLNHDTFFTISVDSEVISYSGAAGTSLEDVASGIKTKLNAAGIDDGNFDVKFLSKSEALSGANAFNSTGNGLGGVTAANAGFYFNNTAGNDYGTFQLTIDSTGLAGGNIEATALENVITGQYADTANDILTDQTKFSGQVASGSSAVPGGKLISSTYSNQIGTTSISATLSNGSLSLVMSETLNAASDNYAFELKSGESANEGFEDIKLELSRTDIEAALVGGDTFDFTVDGGARFQVGANAEQQVGVTIGSVATTELGRDVAGAGTITSLADLVSTEKSALTNSFFDEAIKVIDSAIDEVTNMRGELGAFQANTLESGLNSLRVSNENLTAAESTIRDVDFAKESAEFTRNNILVQSATAMLAQANQLPQGVLQLLG